MVPENITPVATVVDGITCRNNANSLRFTSLYVDKIMRVTRLVPYLYIYCFAKLYIP